MRYQYVRAKPILTVWNRFVPMLMDMSILAICNRKTPQDGSNYFAIGAAVSRGQ